MTTRELYAELGIQLGIKQEADLVAAQRSLAVLIVGDAITRAGGMLAVFETLGASTLASLDTIGRSLITEGERLRGVASEYVEAAMLAKSTERDAQLTVQCGLEPCPRCGTIGAHICAAKRNAWGWRRAGCDEIIKATGHLNHPPAADARISRDDANAAKLAALDAMAARAVRDEW